MPIVRHHAMTTHGGEWIIGSKRHSLQTLLCRSKFSTLTSHKVRMPPKRTPWRRNNTYQHMETYFKYWAFVMEEPLQTVTFVHKFVKKVQQDAKMYQNFIISYLYEAQHVSDDTPPIIRSLKLHWQSVVFHTWKVVWTCSWWALSGTYCAFHVWKTRGCQCSFRLLIMGGVWPETCWSSYKYGIIKFWYIVASCWNFFMNCTMMHGSTNIMLPSYSLTWS
jgi:hypothetical protein